MDQQQPNELDTIEMLRQRGAAIRGLSEPISGGGVVNRFGGSKVSAAIQKEQGGKGFEARPTNDGIMNLILQRNPKFLRKLKALGMGTSGGGGRKTGYAEYNPGTQGGQYAEGGLLSVVNRKTEGSLSLAELGTDYRKLRDIGYGGDPELAKLVEEARLKELGI